MTKCVVFGRIIVLIFLRGDFMSVKKTKLYWIYIVLAILLALVGLVIAPIWSGTDVFFKSWGAKLIDMLLAIALVYYIVIFLLKKVRTSLGVCQILVIVETVLLALVALGCILSQFKVINISEPCQVLGFAMWLRGCVEILSSHFRKNSRYPVWHLVGFLALVTLGTVLFLRPLISRSQFQWALVVLLVILAIYTLVYGARARKPKKQ